MRDDQKASGPPPRRTDATVWRRVRFPLTTGLLVSLLPACSGGGGGGAASSGATSGRAELSVASLSFSPSQVEVGETVHVVDVVRNDGDAAAVGFDVTIHLSADPFVTPGDLLLGVRSVPALAAGATSQGGGFLTVPASVPEGDWYLGCLVDPSGEVLEGDESDNHAVATQLLRVSAQPAPDLAPVDVTPDATVVEAGQLLGVTEAVRNQGPGAAQAFQVGVYLSSDPTITAADVLCGLRSVPGLAPGELSLVSDAVTVPAGLAAGAWYVGVLADVGGVVAEGDEFNNGLAAPNPITVTAPPRPDLRVVELAFSPSVLDAGEALSVQDRVVNQGLAAAGPFRVGVYLSTDGEITTDDTLLGFRALGGLDVGEESGAAAPLVVPAWVGAGTFHVGAVADHEGDVVESDEANNAALALGTLTVHVPPLPDLAAEAVAFGPGVLAAGEELTVVDRVRNVGTAAAGPFRVATYLSNNPSVTAADVLLGWRTVASLAPGAADEGQAAYALPPGLGAGSWTVGVIVDDLDQLQEPSEANNLLAAPGLLDVTGSSDPLPDLLVEQLAGSPSLVLQGGSLTVLSRVRNQGEVSAPAFEVRFYLSEDELVDAGDHLVGTRQVSGLGVGAASAQSFPYTLDPAIPVGHYHLCALVDPAGAVAEADEENNALALASTVEVFVPPPPAPDLWLAELDLDPATVQVGGTLQLSAVVRNVGDLASGSSRVEFHLSEDGEVDATDLLVGQSLTVPALEPGAESPTVLQVTLPPEVVAGTWTLGARVVVLDGPADDGPENDWRTAAGTLEVTP
jgi:subtilase family serine protease